MQNTQQMLIIAIFLIVGYILYTKYYMKDDKESMTEKVDNEKSKKDVNESPSPKASSIIKRVKLPPEEPKQPPTPAKPTESEKVQQLVENIHRKQL